MVGNSEFSNIKFFNIFRLLFKKYSYCKAFYLKHICSMLNVSILISLMHEGFE